MKVTWNWLAEFVEMTLPLERLAERLTLAGLEIESIEDRGRELADVCCAEIVQVRPHPHAERLSVCDVRTRGDAIAAVVCGAPNVRAGARVCHAPPGAMLPGGRRIEATEIRGVASAGMDVSDGLVQDLGHLCRASNLAADIEATLVPLSDAARQAGSVWLPTILTGGDDYELLLAVPPDREAALHDAAREAGIPVTRIGSFRAGAPGVMVRGPDGEPLSLPKGGWSHF